MTCFDRRWAIPNSETFSVPPIGEFVKKYLSKSVRSVDPFARNKKWATITNDLDPRTSADYHMDAEDFLKIMKLNNEQFDLIIFDPPYSPRQISECYKGVGLEVGMKTTQNALLYKRVRDAIIPVITPNGIVLSFGWSTNGMGKSRNFEILEILLVAHGGAHNDTICMAEQQIWYDL